LLGRFFYCERNNLEILIGWCQWNRDLHFHALLAQALAIGADAVLLGRPVLYGLALGGQAGVERVLDILKKEFSLGLALMGCPAVSDLSSDSVLRTWGYHAKM
jgi:hypothetical protein